MKNSKPSNEPHFIPNSTYYFSWTGAGLGNIRSYNWFSLEALGWADGALWGHQVAIEAIGGDHLYYRVSYVAFASLVPGR